MTAIELHNENYFEKIQEALNNKNSRVLITIGQDDKGELIVVAPDEMSIRNQKHVLQVLLKTLEKSDQ